MLPERLPADDYVSFALEYSPVDLIGGDFCHIEQVSESVYNVLLADVAGHGVSAALYTALLHSMVHECVEQMEDPSVFLASLNQRFCVRTPEVGLVTALAMNFDVAGHDVVYSSAGHPPALVQEAQHGAIQELRSMGYPLGVEEVAEFETSRLHLGGGDRVLAYTDGAIELPVDSGNRLGIDGLASVLSGVAPRGSEHRIGELYHALIDRCALPMPEDDITLLSCIML